MDDLGSSHLINDDAFRNLKKIRPAIPDVSDVLQVGNPAVGFLDNIFRIKPGCAAPQPLSDIPFMGQDLSANPRNDFQALVVKQSCPFPVLMSRTSSRS